MRVVYPDFVKQRIHGMYEARIQKKVNRRYLSEATGIPLSKIAVMEYGNSLPDQKSYNRMAKVFDWERWE